MLENGATVNASVRARHGRFFLSAVRIKGDKTDWRTFRLKAISVYVRTFTPMRDKGDAVKARKN